MSLWLSFITGRVRKRPNPHGKPPPAPIKLSQRLDCIICCPYRQRLPRSSHESSLDSLPSLFVAPRAKSGWWLACAWCFYNFLRCSEGARRLCTDAQTDLPGLRCISRGSSSSKWRMCHPISLIVLFERWRVKMYCICFKDTILRPLPAIQSGYPS